MLDSLPVELLRAVFAHVQNKSHLLALSRVSRKFRSHIFPRLFEVLTIKACDEYLPWDLQSHPFLTPAMIAKVPDVIATVKELRFSAPFERTDPEEVGYWKRCHHSTQDLSVSSIGSPRSEDDLYISEAMTVQS